MGELTISPGAVKNLPGLEESVAIVVNGDTAPKAITSGQYLFIKNHSVLATGGYHATAAIASGEDVTSSNVVADMDGIANALKSAISTVGGNVSTLSSNFNTFQTTTTEAINGGQKSGNITLVRSGKMRQLVFDDAVVPAVGYFSSIGTLAAADCPLVYTYASVKLGSAIGIYWVRSTGTFGWTTAPEGTAVNTTITWITR